MNRMIVRRMLAVLCTATAVTAATACQKAATEPPGEDLPDMEADRVMYGVEFFSHADGVKRARTSADTAFAFNNADSATLHLRNMKVEMYDESGAKSGTVTAQSGVINTRTKAMVARGRVVMVTIKEGKRIQTEELHYDPNTHRIWSNVPTLTINRDGSQSRTNTFVTDDKFRSFQATGARGSTGIKF